MALESVGGRQTYFGALPDKNKFGGDIASQGPIKAARYSFSFDDMPGDDDGNEMVKTIPAGAQIVSCYVKIGTAWVGGTSVALGLTDQDGTANDPDGLLDATAGATANLTAGAVLVGAGALIGAVGDATATQVLSSLVVGTYTAGDAEVVVEYIPFGADAA